jgi:hypothetical protein
MRITVTTGSARPRPHIGDRRWTKKHGEQIRVVCTDAHGRWMVRGSRYQYEWRRLEQLAGTQWEYLLK